MLASFKAAITLSFSSFVNFVLSATGVFSGAFNGIILSSAVACLTVFSGLIVLFPAVPIGTVTSPLPATWISSYLKSNSLLAAFTASFTACFSASVSLLVSATVVISGSFNFLPALSNGFTVSLPSNLPVFLPSAVVTVTLPLLSTSTLSPSARLFFALTAAATLSLSACVKLVTSFTSTFLSGAWRLRIVSFCTTVLSAGIVPTLPPWLISTVPSGLTVISSSLKFLSGLASFTACLTFVFSSSVNAFLFSTGTGFSGGLNSLVTSFCLTVFSGANVPVLPSLVFTVTVPSSATVISSFVKFGFAFITASLTLSFSSDVNDFKSFTSTGVGSFNFNSSAVFSQTA